jgi:diketogulonate reductase-like aldo/keto reductase
MSGEHIGALEDEIPMISGTEPSLGAALRASGVPRKEVFITTKLAYAFDHVQWP